jgi:pyridoxamine 5'-phosphate oxidase
MLGAVTGAQGHEQPEASLDRGDLAPTWHEQLARWLQDAKDAAIAEPTAMVLATSSGDAVPSARTVLLKGLSRAGLVFYTNTGSRKGQDLAANPRAGLVFPWFAIRRQVVVAGVVEPVDPGEADAYFATRPYGSQISAHASRQSHVILDRSLLEAAHAELSARFPPQQPVPRPDWWSGYVVAPETVEFWQGRPDRLHDRLRFRLDPDGDWLVERLSP